MHTVWCSCWIVLFNYMFEKTSGSENYSENGHVLTAPDANSTSHTIGTILTDAQIRIIGIPIIIGVFAFGNITGAIIGFKIRRSFCCRRKIRKKRASVESATSQDGHEDEDFSHPAAESASADHDDGYDEAKSYTCTFNGHQQTDYATTRQCETNYIELDLGTTKVNRDKRFQRDQIQYANMPILVNFCDN